MMSVALATYQTSSNQFKPMSKPKKPQYRSGREYYNLRAVAGRNARKAKYGAKRVATVEALTFVSCLIPPVAIAVGVGKLVHAMCTQDQHDTY